jgi:hypothetical protein
MTAETTETTTPRCGHETKSGPCIRPAAHTPNGHMSKAVADAKRTNHAAKTTDPEAAAKRTAERLAKKVERLEADAAALGFKVVPLSKRERAAAAAE